MMVIVEINLDRELDKIKSSFINKSMSLCVF